LNIPLSSMIVGICSLRNTISFLISFYTFLVTIFFGGGGFSFKLLLHCIQCISY